MSNNSDSNLPALVTVIIPVYADEGGMALCLDALRRQSYSPKRIEILVVDNGRNPDLNWITAQDSRCKVIQETKTGSYAARNAGIREAAGEVLAFTDADCIPNEDWIAAGVNALDRDPRCGLVGGAIDVFFLNPASPSAVELYDSVVNLDQKTYINEQHFSATANLITKTGVFELVGVFDERLRSGGDRDWGQRVHAAGFNLLFAPHVVVRHPARHTFKECLRKAGRVSGGNVARLQKQGMLNGVTSVTRFVAEGLAPPWTQWNRSKDKLATRTVGKQWSVFLFMAMMKYVRTFEAVRVLLGRPGRR